MNNMSALLIDNLGLIALLFVICVGIFVILFKDWNTAKRKAKRLHPIYCHDFLEQWDLYRKADTAGCYVILIYKKRPNKRSVRRCANYNEVYVGQSVNMYHRVHKHLTGYGNGDVYADVKYRRFVYLQFIPCKRTQLNAFEKELIEQYHATTSYNRTKGGAKYTPR